MSLVKIEGTSLVRDMATKVVINTNEKELQDYYSRVQAIKAEKDEINKVKSQVCDIKQEMSEIKQLLLSLLEKK
jgi:hypothetical protein